MVPKVLRKKYDNRCVSLIQFTYSYIVFILLASPKTIQSIFFGRASCCVLRILFFILFQIERCSSALWTPSITLSGLRHCHGRPPTYTKSSLTTKSWYIERFYRMHQNLVSSGWIKIPIDLMPTWSYVGKSNNTPMATKVHVILRRFVVLTWMHNNREFV